MNHLRFSKVVRHFSLDNQSQGIILLPKIELGPSLRTLFVAPEFGHQVSSDHPHLGVKHLVFRRRTLTSCSLHPRDSYPQPSHQNTKDFWSCLEVDPVVKNPNGADDGRPRQFLSLLDMEGGRREPTPLFCTALSDPQVVAGEILGCIENDAE
ncbi:hypothetical protein PROFUN_01170 [Planoprotostelium fungivorum]|uniref:Uncharacterized protein n=1 Tax=Planoprotostelium fungivorum TaxID=1890364 RepID=A0A2P6NCJ9_9EUKA|nr:hypothetical protein PROFUN_01170 [Planoprotostelium fungivorum]